MQNFFKLVLCAVWVVSINADCDVCQASNKVACHSLNRYSLCVNGKPTEDFITCPDNYVCTSDLFVCYPPENGITPSCSKIDEDISLPSVEGTQCGVCDKHKTFACQNETTIAFCFGEDEPMEGFISYCPDNTVCDINLESGFCSDISAAKPSCISGGYDNPGEEVISSTTTAETTTTTTTMLATTTTTTEATTTTTTMQSTTSTTMEPTTTTTMQSTTSTTMEPTTTTILPTTTTTTEPTTTTTTMLPTTATTTEPSTTTTTMLPMTTTTMEPTATSTTMLPTTTMTTEPTTTTTTMLPTTSTTMEPTTTTTTILPTTTTTTEPTTITTTILPTTTTTTEPSTITSTMLPTTTTTMEPTTTSTTMLPTTTTTETTTTTTTMPPTTTTTTEPTTTTTSTEPTTTTTTTEPTTTTTEPTTTMLPTTTTTMLPTTTTTLLPTTTTEIITTTTNLPTPAGPRTPNEICQDNGLPGFYKPDNDDTCAKFIVCYGDPIKGQENSCPTGQYFHPVARNCVADRPEGCPDPDTELLPTTIPADPREPNQICADAGSTGFYKTDDDLTCTTYVNCYSLNGSIQGELLYCPSGQYFHPVDKYCLATRPEGCLATGTDMPPTTATSATTISTTTTTTTSAPPAGPREPNQICADAGSTGSYKTDDDLTCTKYILCYLQSGSLHGLIKTCPAGQYFNSKLCSTDKPEGCP